MILSLALAFVLCSCGKPITSSDFETSTFKNALGYDGVSESILLDLSMSLNFDLLPLEGKVTSNGKYWSGDSWRFNQGSINMRWNTKEKEGFKYFSPTRREVITMPPELMKQLSPSEKYDLYMGRYDFPLRWEVDWMARTGSEDWEGLCHGWAGATINHPEPESKTLINPDGVPVYFGSSDIKALLSYAYSKVLIRDEESLGKRCEKDNINGNTSTDEDYCDDDLSPVSFHAVLTNYLGLRGRSVIADIDRFKEVWNHPIVKYESVIERTTRSATGRTLQLRTKITYLDVVNKNSWEKHSPLHSFMTMKYELQLDQKGNITGGKWLSRERPDFFWTIKKVEKFDGYLSGISDLLK